MKSAKAPCPACQAQASVLQMCFLDCIPDLHVGQNQTGQMMKAAALSYNGAPELAAGGAAA